MMKDGRLSTQQTIFGIFIVDNIGHGLCTFAKIWFFYSFSSFECHFLLEFIESVLQDITQAHHGAFCDDAGRYGSRNLRVGAGDYFLPSTGVQDLDSRKRQCSRENHKGSDQKRPQPFQRTISRETEWRKTHRIHRTFHFTGAFEKQLCSNFQSLLSSLRGPVRR